MCFEKCVMSGKIEIEYTLRRVKATSPAQSGVEVGLCQGGGPMRGVKINQKY
jgi:hypothetical protein